MTTYPAPAVVAALTALLEAERAARQRDRAEARQAYAVLRAENARLTALLNGKGKRKKKQKKADALAAIDAYCDAELIAFIQAHPEEVSPA